MQIVLFIFLLIVIFLCVKLTGALLDALEEDRILFNETFPPSVHRRLAQIEAEEKEQRRHQRTSIFRKRKGPLQD